ncbi:MAG: nicotinate (nicotinamide) nucleotide adenylyltransferase [Planctomycetaceae bacterium]|nr:nicotinate (nicotinamide) nucleotide adenylyltransferase [Planctomycetaceae bacterium]
MTLVGILGGSFNPPHRGHLKLAQTVLDLGLTDQVCLLPAAQPPHKATPSQADASVRLTMTRLLAEEDSRLCVDPIELEREGKSYTIETLHRLMNANPGNQYRLVIGSDLAKTFATWRGYRDILRLAPPLVAERPDDPFRGVGDYAGMTDEEADILRQGRFTMSPMDVSSTVVRNLLADGADDDVLLRYLTHGVLAFIREQGLYVGPSRDNA